MTSWNVTVTTTNPEYGYVKFTGDYSKLKGMGFTFQKLYANNYMQWNKNHFRVWKRGHDITHDRVSLFKLIKFFRTNPKVRQFSDKRVSFLKFYSDEANNIYDYHEPTEENIQRLRDNSALFAADVYDEDNPPPYLGDWESISTEDLEFLQELKDMGWYELAYYPED